MLQPFCADWFCISAFSSVARFFSWKRCQGVDGIFSILLAGRVQMTDCQIHSQIEILRTWFISSNARKHIGHWECSLFPMWPSESSISGKWNWMMSFNWFYSRWEVWSVGKLAEFYSFRQYLEMLSGSLTSLTRYYGMALMVLSSVDPSTIIRSLSPIFDFYTATY